MAKRKQRNGPMYLGMKTYLIAQVDEVAGAYGPIHPEATKLLKSIVKVAIGVGNTRAVQAEQRRRRKATAAGRAAKMEKAAERHAKIAAYFDRLSQRQAIGARIAATATRFGVSATTVKAALRRSR